MWRADNPSYMFSLMIQIPPLGLCCDDAMMRQLSVADRPQSICSVSGHMLGPLIANCHSVILMGAGLSAEDLGFESPLCVGYQHPN